MTDETQNSKALGPSVWITYILPMQDSENIGTGTWTNSKLKMGSEISNQNINKNSAWISSCEFFCWYFLVYTGNIMHWHSARKQVQRYTHSRIMSLNIPVQQYLNFSFTFPRFFLTEILICMHSLRVTIIISRLISGWLILVPWTVIIIWDYNSTSLWFSVLLRWWRSSPFRALQAIGKISKIAMSNMSA